MRGRILVISLLASFLGEPLARGLSGASETSVIPLAANPYPGGQPTPEAEAARAQRSNLGQSGLRHNPRLVLAPSPYESALALELAPSPYGAIAPLAPDPYVAEESFNPARSLASSLSEFSASSPRARGSGSRLALAPSPYGLGSAPDLAPNPY